MLLFCRSGRTPLLDSDSQNLYFLGKKDCTSLNFLPAQLPEDIFRTSLNRIRWSSKFLRTLLCHLGNKRHSPFRIWRRKLSIILSCEGRRSLQRPNGMTLNRIWKAFEGNKCRLFHDPLRLFLLLPITRSEIHGRKEHGTFQTVQAYRRARKPQKDKTLFFLRGSRYSALNTRRKNANYRGFFLTSTTGDDQGLSEG
ncbi:hypothetical protein TNCV_3995251 [Trichonephila clavipes]|nr:hypothetical protein TNCV_3995251 [Trichonephila clavipes]